MLFVFDALKISSEKIIVSIINIVVFRFILDCVQKWVLTGAAALFLTIYISGQARVIIFNNINKLRRKLNRKSSNQIYDFDAKNLTSTQMKLNESINSDLSLEPNCQKDLFYYIFNSSSNSALLNLITMISIEILHNKYQFTIIASIFYCVSVAFVVLFAAGYRYSSIVSKEYLNLSNSQKSTGLFDLICVYYTDSSDRKELVCIWTSLLDHKTSKKTIELKFLSAKYASHLSNLTEFFASNQMKLKNAIQPAVGVETQMEEQVVEYYTVLIPDYYDIGLILSNTVKKLGFTQISSWTEFILFPGINFKINTFSNCLKDEKNKKIN